MDVVDHSQFDWKIKAHKPGKPDVSECFYIESNTGKRVLAGWIEVEVTPLGMFWKMFKNDGAQKGRCDTPHEAQTKIEAQFLRIYNRLYHGTQVKKG